MEQAAFPARAGMNRYGLPPEAREFIRRFDAGEAVEPFEFEAQELP